MKYTITNPFPTASQRFRVGATVTADDRLHPFSIEWLSDHGYVAKNGPDEPDVVQQVTAAPPDPPPPAAKGKRTA